ncbi:LysM peptidoglycan-binding domain-containing protein [Lentzea sp. JNUCC 0626]|uniref:LysM peptidoglycan-binding domain-containing protein n=1 Tax=Lentzea sp. JNUCC 0626 TaxID=3367513 RepID=UPI003749C06E
MDHGIDVSMWNAINDANAVRANGITYAWVKATEGVGYVDPSFFAKVRQLKAAGIVVGAYAFLRAGSGAAQARHFRTVAGDAGCLDAGSLLPMLDMEAADVRSGANSYVTEFYDTLRVEPAEVYGNLDWWRNVLSFSYWGSRNLLGHIAHYNGAPGQPGWSYPRAAVHQHTQEGIVPGIAGHVDRNATLGTYNLRSLTLGQVAPPIGPPTGGGSVADPGDVWTVAAGDTLSRIASAWGTTVSAVAVANAIPNADLIYVGQRIRKPGTNGAAPGPVAGTGTYTVRSGDTLSEIAAQNGTTVAVLVALNRISNPDRIYAGQQLVLPGNAAAPAERVYVVQAGDTLGGIASELAYPGGYPALASRNGISDPDKIYPGQRLFY